MPSSQFATTSHNALSNHAVSDTTENPTLMTGNDFQVIYIDKFADPVQSQWVTDSLCKKFHLNLKQRMHLSSGQPVLIKQGVSLAKAQQLAQVVKEEGGICWVQAGGPEPGFHDRRSDNRRSGIDRRANLRASSVVPERRMGDRRQEYVH